MQLSNPDIERFRRAGLTPRQMLCLAWYYFDNVEQPQIAAWLGIRQPNVYRLLRRGRARLSKVGIDLPESRGRRPTPQMSYRSMLDPSEIDSLQPEQISGIL